jgi:hypothetical protein
VTIPEDLLGHPGHHEHGGNELPGLDDDGLDDDDRDLAGDEADEPAAPHWARAAWRRSSWKIKPFAYPPAVYGTAVLTHALAGGGLLNCLWATGGVAACAAAAAKIRTRESARRDPSIRRNAYAAVAAGSAWALPATMASPAGWAHCMQFLALGGFGLSARHVTLAAEERRRRPEPEEPEPEEPEEPRALPSADPPELAWFKATFTDRPGAPLYGANASVVMLETGRGHYYDLIFPEDCPHSSSDASSTSVLITIAKHFRVSSEKVSAGYVPGHRSEHSARITVTTARDLSPESRRWDGRTTWDPKQGTISPGSFADGTRSHYLLFRPRSGAWRGIVAGMPGGGKTGTLHRIAADAAQAMMCGRCLGQGTCVSCNPERIIAVWFACPQTNVFSVWEGRADLVAKGPEGCTEMLQLAMTLGDLREKQNNEMEWTDHLGRPNKGRGFFDPEPGLPGILLILDEFPKLVTSDDKDLRTECIADVGSLATLFRKLGIHALLGTQITDISQTGIREIKEPLLDAQTIGHRMDESSAGQAGMGKNKADRLDPNDPSSAFFKGIDRRPDVIHHTDWVPEYSKPGETGIDIREIADRIAGTSIRYDPAVMQAFEAHGIRHQDVLTEWKGRPGLQEASTAGVAAVAGSRTDAAAGVNMAAVRDVLDGRQAAARGVTAHQLMERHGITLREARAELDRLGGGAPAA